MHDPPHPYWTDRRIRIDGIGGGRLPTVVLDKPYALIGSHPKAECRLDGDGVKRRHLFVLATDEGIHVLDLVQGRQQGKPCGFWLQSAQILAVGEHRIKLCFADRELPDSIPDNHLMSTPAKRPYPMIVCRSDGEIIGQPYLNRSLAIVGRRESCKFQFTTRSVSPEHCAFFQQQGRLWVIDFHSTRQTRKNGKRVDCAELQHGSHVKLGRVEIETCLGSAPGSAVSWDQEPSHLQEEPPPLPETLSPERQPPPSSHDPLAEQLNQPELKQAEIRSENVPFQADLVGQRQEVMDLQLALQQQKETILQLQADLAIAAIELQDQEKSHESREKAWQEKESQLLKRAETETSRSENIQRELASIREESTRLSNQLENAQSELSDRDSVLVEMESVRTLFRETQERLETVEEELLRERLALGERDQLIETLSVKTESQDKELLELNKQLQIRREDEEEQAKQREAAIQQRTIELENFQNSLDQREARLLSTAEQYNKEIKQLAISQAEQKRFTAEQLTRQEELSRLKETLDLRESEIQQHQAEIEHQRTELEKQKNVLLEERELHLQQATEAERQWREATRELQQEEQKLTEQKAKQGATATDLEAFQRETEQLAKRLAKERDTLDQQRKVLETERAQWEALVAASETENQGGREAGAGAGDHAKSKRPGKLETSTQQAAVVANRHPSDHYHSIDHAQRQVLVNLGALQKEKSRFRGIWRWMANPFRRR